MVLLVVVDLLVCFSVFTRKSSSIRISLRKFYLVFLDLVWCLCFIRVLKIYDIWLLIFDY